MIIEAVLASATAITLGAYWLAERLHPSGIRRRLLLKQRAHWSEVLRASYNDDDRKEARKRLGEIDRDLLADTQEKP